MTVRWKTTRMKQNDSIYFQLTFCGFQLDARTEWRRYTGKTFAMTLKFILTHTHIYIIFHSCARCTFYRIIQQGILTPTAHTTFNTSHAFTHTEIPNLRPIARVHTSTPKWGGRPHAGIRPDGWELGEHKRTRTHRSRVDTKKNHPQCASKRSQLHTHAKV